MRKNNNMRNLFERLKDGPMQAIMDEAKRYPCTVREIVNSLKNNTIYLDVPYGVVLNIESCTKQRFTDIFEFD